MKTLQYQITIDESKVQDLYAFLTSLRFVHEVIPLPTNGQQIAQEIIHEPYYTPNQLAYSVAEIKAIANRFPKNKLWTVQDLDTYFPPDLSIKVEIIRNRLYIMPTPRENHQLISNELLFAFNVHVKKHKLGQMYHAPLDVMFDDNNTFQPDILFIKIERRANAVSANGKIVIAPDLVVEIWSPSNRKKEREQKREMYESFGVTEYWSIYPKKKHITVEILNEIGKYELFSEAKQTGKVQSKILDGFEIDIDELITQEIQEAEETTTEKPKNKRKKKEISSKKEG
ncbi:MAG: Uma2 family endonuclease [Cytophagia bacterium]|nr:MAG: Uma2 family endonuclease [Cytophagia bacterium]